MSWQTMKKLAKISLFHAPPEESDRSIAMPLLSCFLGNGATEFFDTPSLAGGQSTFPTATSRESSLSVMSCWFRTTLDSWEGSEITGSEITAEGLKNVLLLDELSGPAELLLLLLLTLTGEGVGNVMPGCRLTCTYEVHFGRFLYCMEKHKGVLNKSWSYIWWNTRVREKYN